MKSRGNSQLGLGPMAVNRVAPASPLQGNTVALEAEETLSLKRRFIREAIDESGWKHAAVAVALGVKGPYLSKMLAGEKPITQQHIDALPDDVERIYLRKHAESLDLLVVPIVSEAEADRQFATGLFNKLCARRTA